MKVWAVLVAGGQGARFGAAIPKQFTVIDGEFLLAKSLRVLLQSPIAGVVVTTDAVPCEPVIAKTVWDQLLEQYKDRVFFVAGGDQRCWSVKNGIDVLVQNQCSSTDYVLVHDGARPCLHPEDLNELLAACDTANAVMLGQPLSDSLKQVSQSKVETGIPRDGLWCASTPQGASLEHFLNAYQLLNKMDFNTKCPTDECELLKPLGLEIQAVHAQHANPKLTYKDDLVFVTALLRQRSFSSKG